MFGNGNDKTNISANILLVFITMFANFNANGEIEVFRNILLCLVVWHQVEQLCMPCGVHNRTIWMTHLSWDNVPIIKSIIRFENLSPLKSSYKQHVLFFASFEK